jgi:hypothetical protein
VPASADTFVWLRLYQAQMAGLVPPGRDQPLWWTLRRPFWPLAYHAAHRMFTRASAALGANWSLHDLRQMAAYQLRRGVASDATFRRLREAGAARDGGPGTAGWRSQRQNEPAGQDGCDRTALRQMPGCCAYSGCIRRKHDAAKQRKSAATRADATTGQS